MPHIHISAEMVQFKAAILYALKNNKFELLNEPIESYLRQLVQINTSVSLQDLASVPMKYYLKDAVEDKKKLLIEKYARLCLLKLDKYFSDALLNLILNQTSVILECGALLDDSIGHVFDYLSDFEEAQQCSLLTQLFVNDHRIDRFLMISSFLDLAIVPPKSLVFLMNFSDPRGLLALIDKIHGVLPDEMIAVIFDEHYLNPIMQLIEQAQAKKPLTLDYLLATFKLTMPPTPIHFGFDAQKANTPTESEPAASCAESRIASEFSYLKLANT